MYAKKIMKLVPERFTVNENSCKIQYIFNQKAVSLY